MHLRYVEIFCDVAALRSFSKAAAAHTVSQSSASQAVHALEERLGTRLIDRSKRPLELTPAGRIYFDGCRDLLSGFRNVEDRIRALENKVTGRVRVAAIYSVGLLRMDQHVRAFRESYPEADVSVDYRHPDEVYERVIRGDADLGIVSYPRESADVAGIPWLEQEMVLVVPMGHRFAERDTVTPTDLHGLEFVGFPRELTIRRETDRWLDRHGIEPVVVHEFDSIENVKRDVEIGTGVALLPTATVDHETRIGTLKAISISPDPPVRPLGIVHDAHHALSNAACRFVELLRDVADDTAGEDRAGEGPPSTVEGTSTRDSRETSKPNELLAGR